jgi:YVTN family beta-propeller protein
MIKQAAMAAAAVAVVLGMPSAVSAAQLSARPSAPVGTVTEFNPALAGRVTFKVGRFPSDMRVAPDGKTLYVANYYSDSITAIRRSGGRQTVKTIHVGGAPQGLAITPDSKTLYVSRNDATTGTGDVLAFRASSYRLMKSIPVFRPGAIAITPNGRTAYILSASLTTTDVTVTPIRTATNKALRAIRIGRHLVTVSITITPNGRTAYVLGDDYARGPRTKMENYASVVIPIRTDTNHALTRITVDRYKQLGGTTPAASYLVVTPDSRALYVSGYAGVTPIRTASNTAGKPIGAGTYPFGMVVAPDGKTVYVVNDGNEVIPIQTATNTAGPAIVTGSRYPDPNPGGLAVSPDGHTLYVVTWASGQLAGIVLPINTVNHGILPAITAGLNPTRLVIAPDGGIVYVLDQVAPT